MYETDFLPQDKVCEFEKLTPMQLLEETEKVVGDPQLPNQHRVLMNNRRELKHVVLEQSLCSMHSGKCLRK